MTCLHLSALPTAGTTPIPQPVHHAIDLLTVALLDVQALRAHLVLSDKDDTVERIDTTLHRLAEVLIQMRDAA